MQREIADRMTDHVLQLATEHRTKLKWVRGWRNAEAYPSARIAVVPEILQPSDYLFGLHELGHVALKHPMEEYGGRLDCSITRQEGEAWAWASAAALPALARHLRAKDWNRVAYAFRTYLDTLALDPEASSQECPGRSVRHSRSTA